MAFIRFVLTIPTSRTSTGDRVEPFSSHKGEGLALGTEEETARHFPIPTIRFCSFHFFDFPCHWRSTSIPWEGGDRSIYRRIEKRGNRRGDIFVRCKPKILRSRD